jgi:NAD(P)-dependent dehydrogenase (short-subunit alcohol dehydrogenase family)/acyl carrier protein
VENPLEPLLDPDSPFYLSNQARPWLSRASHSRRAAISAFGFGGSNFCCLAEEGQSQKTEAQSQVGILALSGPSPSVLKEALSQVGSLSGDPFAQEDLCQKSLSLFNPAERARLALCFRKNQMGQAISEAISLDLDFSLESQISTPGLRLFSEGLSATPPAPLCLKLDRSVPERQNFWEADLLGALSLSFPEAQNRLDQLSRAWEEEGRPSLGGLLWIPKEAMARLGEKRSQLLSQGTFQNCLYIALSLAFRDLLGSFGLGFQKAYARGLAGLLAALALKGAISPERAYAFLKEIPQGPDIPERALSDLGDSLELAFPEGPGHEENLEIYGSGKLIASPEEAKTELKASLLRERLSSPDRASGQSGQEEEAARSLADGQEIIGPECLLEKSFYPSSSPSEDTLSDGTFGLASLLCRIAASGRPLRLSPWPAQKSCPILEARPSGHFVPLTGANTYKPQEMPPPRLPKPAGKESSEETGNAREAGVAGDGLALLADLQKQGLKLLESIDRKLGPGPGESHFPAHLPQAHFSGRPSSLSASSASKAASGPASGQSSGFYNIPLGTREDEGRRVYPASLGASGHISLPSGQAPSPSAARAALASADSQSLAFSPQVAFRGGLAAEGQALSSALPSPSSGNGRFKGRPGNGQGLYRETGQAVDEGKAYAKATWETLCQVVARETGYPPESLSPSLDLERDLGLDSIKKVELLSELANVFPALSTDMGQDGKGSLADLAARCQGGHIIPEGKGFGPAKDQRDSYSPLPGASKRPHAPSGSAADVSLSDREAYIMAPDQADALFSILARETGYPQSALRPEMELESDLGLDSIKKVEILAALSEGLSVADPLSLSSAVTIADLLSSLGAEASRPGKAALAPEGGPLPGQAAKGPALSPLSAIPPRQPNRAASLEAGPGQDALYLSLLEVVARETGYPPQALSPDMSLEGDLGLDSIKKVEILASLAESAPGAFRSEEQSSLNQAQTLGEWLRFFAPSPQAPDRLPDKLTDRAQSQAPVLAAISGQMSPSSPSLGQSLLDRLTVKKEDERAPARPKSPKPLGPDLPDSADGAGPQKPKAFSGQDLPDGPDDHREPSLWQVAPQAIKLSPEPQAAFPEGGLIRLVGQGALAKSLERELLAKGLEAKRYSWHYDFSSFNQEGKAAKTLIFIWPGPDRDASLVIKALSALKNAGPDLSCLVGLTFLGGYFAYPKAPGHLSSPGNSISASLIGLIKCAAKEWPEVRARVLDLPLAVYETPLPSFVSAILEAAPAPGPLEMGIPSSQETSALKLRPYRPRADFSPISPGDTLVVTGGGRGVTAAVLRELCRKYRPHLVLLGRTPLGPPEPDWLRALSTDQEIMEALFKISGGNPRDLSARAKLIMAAREIRDNLSAFEAAGAKADYISGDYSDAAYLDQVARKVRSRFGPVKGFIHGAGIISDRPIKAKDPDDFAKVYATKTQMAFMLLEAFQNQPLKLIAFFSSSTARFGREGQSDYAAGNEVLNKTASELSSLYPQARVLSCAWGPWAGGMVTKSLSAQFRSEGIGLIDLEAGAQTFLRLIESPPGSPAEILVLGPDTDLSLLPGLAESPGEDDFPLSCDLSGPDSAVQGKSSSGEALGPPSGSQALRGSFR